VFGVSQEKYEAERDARVRAEAIVETLRGQIALLQGELKTERERVSALVEHIAPKPQAPDSTLAWTGKGDGPAQLTSEQIMAIPAVGGRGLRQRNNAARLAKLRDVKKAEEEDAGARRAVLTEEEEQILDESIPGKR
jgi:hypothetical protein